MRSNASVRIILLVGLSVAGAGAPLRGQTPPDDPQVRANLDAARKQVQETNNEIIEITSKLSRKGKDDERQVQGPPSKDKMFADESQSRLEILKTMVTQLQSLNQQVEQARNPAERQVLARDAALKAEAARHFGETITGPPAAAPPPVPADTAASTGSRGGVVLHFNSGALQQLELANAFLTDAVTKRDPEAALARSVQAFGDGRAGAGGVTLYKAATVLAPFVPGRMTNASVRDGRLVLTYAGKELLLPRLDPVFLAIAIRSVYGGEGLVRGTLLANEENAVVLRTGKGQYGDVAWKKEFLPQLPATLAVGDTLDLDLGPGVGALDLPEASYERITYYGPIRNNALGQILLESDMVYSMFWFGIDWTTGMPLDSSSHPGYQSAIDIDLDGPAEVVPQAEREKSRNWWEDIVWFVWSPDEMTLALAAGGNELEFVKATMRVVVWSVRAANVDARSKAQGEFLSRHFDDFAGAFPQLARLREAAMAVAVVRWLKQNKVPLDRTWAMNYPVEKVITPERIRRYAVYVDRDDSGKPLVEAPVAAGRQ